uniref:Uncharacterized protein n=1 Tax=Arundo donax TaxID=35708 RepID=A0A0A9DM21_ARUDO
MSFHTIERLGAALTLSQCKGFNLGRGNPSLPTCVGSGSGGGSGGWPKLCPLKLRGGFFGGGGGGGDFGILVALDGWKFSPLAELLDVSLESKLTFAFDTLNVSSVLEGVVYV